VIVEQLRGSRDRRKMALQAENSCQQLKRLLKKAKSPHGVVRLCGNETIDGRRGKNLAKTAPWDSPPDGR
jgi:hypothetical protein